MKAKMIKTLSSFLMAVALLMIPAASVHARDTSVRYDGGAEKFVFLPGNESSATDLFDNFKDVMPGDVVTQRILVTNNRDGISRVKIYLRAETHVDDGSALGSEVTTALTERVSMNDFLSKLSMKVKNGDTVIYEAAADQLDGLRENVLLGTFQKGEGTTLTVELSVPVELGNEYASRVGEVDWIFTAEEIEDSNDSGHSSGGGSSDSGSSSAGSAQEAVQSPKTGDDSHAALWAGIAIVAAMVIALVFRMRRRQGK